MNESKYLLIEEERKRIDDDDYDDEAYTCEEHVIGVFDDGESARIFLEDYLKPSVTVYEPDKDDQTSYSYVDVLTRATNCNYRLERVDYFNSK